MEKNPKPTAPTKEDERIKQLLRQASDAQSELQRIRLAPLPEHAQTQIRKALKILHDM